MSSRERSNSILTLSSCVRMIGDLEMSLSGSSISIFFTRDLEIKATSDDPDEI